MTFLNSILKNSKKYEFPFNHWEYNNALSEEAIKEIEGADIPDVSKHNLNYDGTRAIDGGAAEFREGIASGGKAIKFRCFVTKENASQFPHLVKFINELQSKETCETISKMINKDLSGSYVRLEVICTAWKKKKLLKKDDVFKSIMLHLKLIGRLIKYFVETSPLIFLF